MWEPVGFWLNFAAVFAMLVVFIWYTCDRMQNKVKALYLLSLPVLSLVFVGLTQVRGVEFLFATLSLLFPLLMFLTFGALFLLLAIYQGFNSISWMNYVLVLLAICGVAGSVLLMIAGQR